MATQIEVHTAELQLTTVKLSPKIIKQLPRLSYEQIKPLLKAPGSSDEPKSRGSFIGWLNGAAVDGDRYQRYILVKLWEGEYGLFNCLESTVENLRLKQIFVP